MTHQELRRALVFCLPVVATAHGRIVPGFVTHIDTVGGEHFYHVLPAPWFKGEPIIATHDQIVQEA